MYQLGTSSFIHLSSYKNEHCVVFSCRLKLLEINAGVDGFMVYDMDLIEPMQKVNHHKPSSSSLSFGINSNNKSVSDCDCLTAVPASLSGSEPAATAAR